MPRKKIRAARFRRRSKSPSRPQLRKSFSQSWRTRTFSLLIESLLVLVQHEFDFAIVLILVAGRRDEPCLPLRPARLQHPGDFLHLVKAFSSLARVSRALLNREFHLTLRPHRLTHHDLLVFAVTLHDQRPFARLAQRRPIDRRPVFHFHAHNLYPI